MSGISNTAGIDDPVSEIPDHYNSVTEFVDRHLPEGRGDKVAVIDDTGSHTYGELAERVNRAGNAIASLGISSGDRVAMVLLDSIDFPTVFWGCIKAGIIPVPLNTLLTTADYEYILNDSEARVLVVSEVLYPLFEPLLDMLPALISIVIAGDSGHGHQLLSTLLDSSPPALEPAVTSKHDIAFWLYSSGSTGKPKGVMHKHVSLRCTARLYASGILGISEQDRVFSAAKLFFAYGLGNAMTFPFFAGATTILMAVRPTPDSVLDTIHRHKPDIYFGVPSLYAAILAGISAPVATSLRLCVSAGEALPGHIGRDWEKFFAVPILDGLGSTEMLHIYLSHRPGGDYYGTTGIPVPGYQLRLVDENGQDAAEDEPGELIVKGPSAAAGYWNQPEKTRQTFRDGWTYTGDKYTRDKHGYYVYSGRNDDMFKVSGQWVSPFEIESTIARHPSVIEAAVVACADNNGLIKPRAWVVLKSGQKADAELAREIQDFVKSRISKHKYPRWIEFVTDLPKTATGKIQRFKLRDQNGNKQTGD